MEMNQGLFIARRIPFSKVNGPGNRYVIWVQGCSIQCEGCFNPEMIPKGGTWISVKTLIKEIHEVDDIDGVTISGGEPLDQMEGCLALCKACKETGLSVVLYTGYEIEDKRLFKGVMELFNSVDFFISGPYQKDLPPAYLRGSNNQRIILISDRYKDLVLQKLKENPVEMEFQIDGKRVEITGIPSSSMKNAIK